MVAAAAALLEKVARLSVKRWSGAADALARAHALRLRSEELIEHDLHGYLAYVEAMRSGGDVGRALAKTIEVPLDIVRAALEVVELAAQLAAHGNPKLRADAVAAAILAVAAAETSAMLISVNVLGADDVRLDEARKLAAQAREKALSLKPQGS